MGYYINPSLCASMFALPTEVVDKHLKIASAAHLRVLLWSLRNSNTQIDEETVAKNLGLDLDTVSDAFLYWTQAGVLCSTEAPVIALKTETEKTVTGKIIKPRAQKPSRSEIAKLGLSDEKLRFLLDELQSRYGRELRQTELSTFVWLYDYHGMDISVMLMLVEYALSSGKTTVAFIEKTALDWLGQGVNDIEGAEKLIISLHEKRSAWHVVETAMGIEHRQPSDKELELSHLWVNEWSFSREILKAAYNACIDATAKLSFPYIKKILDSWHTAGVKTVDDIAKLEQDKTDTAKTGNKSYYDIAKSMMFTNEDKD